mgnify:CR=1 FL=1
MKHEVAQGQSGPQCPVSAGARRPVGRLGVGRGTASEHLAKVVPRMSGKNQNPKSRD